MSGEDENVKSLQTGRETTDNRLSVKLLRSFSSYVLYNNHTIQCSWHRIWIYFTRMIIFFYIFNGTLLMTIYIKILSHLWTNWTLKLNKLFFLLENITVQEQTPHFQKQQTAFFGNPINNAVIVWKSLYVSSEQSLRISQLK